MRAQNADNYHVSSTHRVDLSWRRLLLLNLNTSIGSIDSLRVSDFRARSSSHGSALDALRAVDTLFDLSRSTGNPLEAIGNLDRSALKEFIAMTVRLLKAGIVGTETYDRDGRPYTTFITTGMADPKLRGLPHYRDRFDTERVLNTRA